MTKQTEKDFIDLKGCPIGVCQVSKTEAAVTMNNKNYLVCVTWEEYVDYQYSYPEPSLLWPGLY